MNTSWLVLGGMGVGALFNQIKEIFVQVRSILLPSLVIQWSDGGQDLCRQSAGFFLNGVKSFSGNACNTYTGRYTFIKTLNKFGLVPVKVFNESYTLFWYKGRPMLAKRDEKSWSIHVIYIRFTLNPDKLMHELTEYLAKGNNTDRFLIKRLAGSTSKFNNNSNKSEDSRETTDSSGNLVDTDCVIGWDRSCLGEFDDNVGNPIDNLGLSDDTLTKVDRVLKWYESKSWYNARQIPWRRGILLEGPPGTGKSALVKALGQKLNIPIYVLDISTMDNTEFHDSYRKAKIDSPCIVLIEDIDAVFCGRVNKASKQGCGVTFDCFLNCISGVESSDGVLLAISANNVSNIDSALTGSTEEGSTVTSRPGRIDDVIHMGVLSESNRVKLASRYMMGLPEPLINEAIAMGDGYTGAQFQDMCNNMALEAFWKDNE